MDKKRKAIAPGVNLTSVETADFKQNLLEINFFLPLSASTAAEYALIPPVLRRGCAAYPTTRAIEERKQYLYATHVGAGNYKRGETQVIAFNMLCLDNSFIPSGEDIYSAALELLTGIIFDPATEGGLFRADYVTGEKKTLTDSIKAVINDPARYANKRMIENMCAGENYSVAETGTVESVAAVTPEALTAAWRRMLATAPVEIVYVGRDADKNAAVAAQKISDAFAAVRREPAPMPGVEVLRAPKGEVREVIEESPVRQGKLSIGLRSGHVMSDPDYYKYAVMEAIFGRGTTSKLFINVREKMSLCYYCSASTENRKGVMFIQSGIEVDKYEVAKAEILRQLDAVKNGEITEDELDAAKKELRNGYLAVTDSPWSILNWIMRGIFSGNEESPEEAIAKIESVSIAEAAEAAKSVALDTIYFLKGTLYTGEAKEGGEE
jgi:predicted Zn-dependent peptidase